MSLTASGLNVQTAIAALDPDRRRRLRDARTGRGSRRRPMRHDVHPVPGPHRGLQAAAARPQTVPLVFKQSVRGLAAGAPVEFRGIQIGEVVGVGRRARRQDREFSSPVTVRVDAKQLGVKLLGARDPAKPSRRRGDSMHRRTDIARLARPAPHRNLLTGALYVAFDLFPGAPPATVDWTRPHRSCRPFRASSQAIEASIVSIVKKIDKDAARGDRRRRRKGDRRARRTLAERRGTLDNAGQADRAELGAATSWVRRLEEVRRAARALRVLADYLERHPEALLRGKTGEAK